MDFREDRTIGEKIEEDNIHLKTVPGYDHNYILNRRYRACLQEHTARKSVSVGNVTYCTATEYSFTMWKTFCQPNIREKMDSLSGSGWFLSGTQVFQMIYVHSFLECCLKWRTGSKERQNIFKVMNEKKPKVWSGLFLKFSCICMFLAMEWKTTEFY